MLGMTSSYHPHPQLVPPASSADKTWGWWSQEVISLGYNQRGVNTSCHYSTGGGGKLGSPSLGCISWCVGAMQLGPSMSQACDLVPPSVSCLLLSFVSCKSDEIWRHLIRKGGAAGMWSTSDEQEGTGWKFSLVFKDLSWDEAYVIRAVSRDIHCDWVLTDHAFLPPMYSHTLPRRASDGLLPLHR